MCGICGTLNWEPALDEAALQAMTARIAHRGPDDAGHWRDDLVALGFRRLSIIDLSPAGQQPMTNEDSSLWLVYNGETYNYPELRTQLLQHGHTFHSQTDSECLLHGYEEWGPQMVARLRGMVAFALWDQPNQTLLLGRDRLGIKPLYYYWDGRRFAFASEIKALTALPAIDLSIDHSALWDYLTYLYVPTPKTVYRHIRQLPPGHTLTIQPGAAPQVREYWDVTNWGLPLSSAPPHLANPAAYSHWPQAVEQLREALLEALRLHLIADVPVGLMLSGGLDSSTITAYAQKMPGTQLKSFSIGFDVAEHTELPFARQVAAHCHTDHYERTVTGSSLEAALTQMLTLYDQPFADASGIPTLAVSDLAAQQVKVALSGDGGDELFAGYVWYRLWYDLAAAERLPAALRAPLYERLLLPALTPLAGLPKMTALISHFRIDVHGKRGANRYGAMVSRIKSFQKPRLLPDLAHEFRDYDDYWHYRRYWRDDLDPLSAMQYVDMKTYLPDDILTKVDRASMAVSLELRPPLLDHKLVELVAALPPEFRFDKRILRAAVADMLPAEIITRPKKGFSVPLLNWLSPITHNGARLGGLQLWAYRLLAAWQANNPQSVK